MQEILKKILIFTTLLPLIGAGAIIVLNLELSKCALNIMKLNTGGVIFFLKMHIFVKMAQHLSFKNAVRTAQWL